MQKKTKSKTKTNKTECVTYQIKTKDTD